VSEKFLLKSVNIWQSYKQERGCLMLFVRLASTSLKDLKDEESARDSHVLACNFARYLLFLAHAVYTPERAVCLGWTSGPAGRAVSSMHATAESLLL